MGTFTQNMKVLAFLALAAFVGLSQSASLKKVGDCDGTVCPGGCCPEQNWYCCPDGMYCAADASNCPFVAAKDKMIQYAAVKKDCECEGTMCPGGCCPEHNWYCCPEYYCAATPQDCAGVKEQQTKLAIIKKDIEYNVKLALEKKDCECEGT